jgi:phenylacetate-CoA ligase
MMLYNKVLESIILPLGDFLNGSSFVKELRKWRAIQHLSEDAIQKLQADKLRRLLEHALDDIPYYKNQFVADRNVDARELIKQFPVIRKHMIKEDITKFVCPSAKNLIPYESSGSSGIQGKIFMNKTEQSVIRAILILWWEWAGYRIGNALVQTGMTVERGLLKTLKDFFFRTKYFVAFGLEDKTIRPLLAGASGGKYQHLAGYASSLYLIARTEEEYSTGVEFRSVISWGDKMFPHFREKIESVFNTKVFDTYACNEGIMIAAQYDLPYYYIMSPHVYVEIVDAEGNEVPDGELGYVVVTQLDNFSMPLIRYYNGDLAIKLPRHKYPQKRKLNFPLLERIIGRDTDIVKTRSGKNMIVHFFTGIFEFYPTIKQFRVLQDNLDSIVIEYIKEPGFDASILDEITSNIHQHLEEPFKIEYRCVSFIPSTASGKPQIIKSELK